MELSTTMPALWNQYLEDRPFHTTLDDEGDGVYIVRVWQDPPPPEQIAVMIGEWLYNVRSALDYIIWAAAAHQSGTVPTPADGQLQYPIYDSAAAWKANLYRLNDLGEHHRAHLKAM